MCEENLGTEREDQRRSPWGLLGAAALLGLAAATIIIVNKTRGGNGRRWSVDDLIDAADKAADNIERTLLGETARAS